MATIPSICSVHSLHIENGTRVAVAKIATDLSGSRCCSIRQALRIWHCAGTSIGKLALLVVALGLRIVDWRNESALVLLTARVAMLGGFFLRGGPAWWWEIVLLLCMSSALTSVGASLLMNDVLDMLHEAGIAVTV